MAGLFDELEKSRPLIGSEKIRTSRGPNKGMVSTERTRTILMPDGMWANINSLWMQPSGTITDLGHWNDDRLGMFAQHYELKLGVRYPRFKTLSDALNAARARSKSGGAASGNSLLMYVRPQK